MYYSTLDVFRSWVFQVQFAIALCINFGVNFGFEWATLSDYGERDALVDIWFWKMNAVNTSIVADVLLTSFLIGYLPIVLATWGIKVESRSAPKPARSRLHIVGISMLTDHVCESDLFIVLLPCERGVSIGGWAVLVASLVHSRCIVCVCICLFSLLF